MQTNRSNEIMKALTLISSILLPLTFIASLYGMNVKLPFMNHEHTFLALMIMMLAISGGFIFFFKTKKWM